MNFNYLTEPYKILLADQYVFPTRIMAMKKYIWKKEERV